MPKQFCFETFEMAVEKFYRLSVLGQSVKSAKIGKFAKYVKKRQDTRPVSLLIRAWMCKNKFIDPGTMQILNAWNRGLCQYPQLEQGPVFPELR